MLAHVGMVRRAIQGEVQRHLKAQRPGFPEEKLEVVHRAEGGLDRAVAAGRAADGPRRPDVAGLADGGVVLALAVGDADRVDGRQVDHVEAHAHGVFQRRPTVAEGGVGDPVGDRIAREELVPRREARLLPLDDHGVRHRMEREQGAVRPVGQHGGHLRRLDQFQRLPRGQTRQQLAQLDQVARDLGLALQPGPQGGPLHQQGTFLQFQVERHHRRLDLLAQLVPPGGQRVRPRRHPKLVAPGRGEAQGRRPAVVLHRHHRHLAPGALAFRFPEHGGRDLVVAILEHIRLDHQGFVGDPFHRMAPTVDRGREAGDDDGWSMRDLGMRWHGS